MIAWNGDAAFVATVKRFARAECDLRGKRGLTAVRCTGVSGKSGIFQCYVPARTGGLTSIGPNIHAVERSGRIVCERRGNAPRPYRV